MKDVFVGFLFDEAMEAQLLATSRSGISTASNQYQQGFLSGLGKPVKILTTLSVGAYPRGNKRLWFRRKKTATPYGEITYLPFVNFYFIRDYLFRKGLIKELSRIISRQDCTTVYVYSLFMPSLKAIEKIKKKFPDKMRLCMIIPDLPGKYGIVRKGIKGLRDRQEVKKKLALPNCADSFVFLTEPMKELFAPKSYAVIEGFLPSCSFDYTAKRIPKSVLYTGSLNRAYGFATLLEAFSRIPDPEAQLWVCGAGDMENAVKEAAKQDPRIQFKGFLPKSEVVALQTQCDVLVNPRTDEGEYTRYSFPSKTMEYLLSGSKVVMHRLAGVPEEYYSFIRTIDGDSPEAMVKALTKAWADTDFYTTRFREQITWIRESKSAEQQIKKLK